MFNMLDVGHGKVKYWIDELPLTNVTGSLTIEDYIPSRCSKTFANTKVALEIFLPKNNSYYGLLGVEYLPAIESNDLRIIFNFTTKNDYEYKDSILKDYEKVFMGLIEYYLDYTRNKIKECLYGKNKIQSGVLNFIAAANSEVGSSPKLFGAISEMLIEMIIRTGNKQLDTDMDEIVKDIFYSSSLFKKRETQGRVPSVDKPKNSHASELQP